MTPQKYTVQSAEGPVLELFPATGTIRARSVNHGTGAVALEGIGEDEASTGIASEVQAALAAKQPLTGNTFTVATVPSAAANVGRVILVTDGDGAAGPTGAISDGTDWLIVGTLGAAVSTGA